MKYKVLVMGKNNPVIDGFFIHMDDCFEVISTSTRYGDIIRHLKYFVPDAVVYCLHAEAQESMRQMITIKPLIQQYRTPFIVIGDKIDCDEFEKLAINVSNLTIVKPFTEISLKETILKFMDERKEYVAAYKNKDEEAGVESEESTLKRRDVESMDIDSLRNVVSNLDKMLSGSEPADNDETLNTAGEKKAAAGETKITAGTVDESPLPDKDEMKDLPGSGDENTSTEEERKHILVIDDDPVMLKTVKEHLHGEYDVATAISGKIAMKFLERKHTDLILLDYEMPGENGPAILEKIRKNDAIKNIPVVFLTGVSEREKIQEAIALKPQGYLLKPINHDKLMETINNYT